MTFILATSPCSARVGRLIITKIDKPEAGAPNRIRRGPFPARSAASDVTPIDLKLIGPEPQRFTVAEGELQNIASAAFGTIIRGGCGVLCSGYNISFQGTTPDNVGQYSVLPNLPFGLRLKESSAVSGFHRPQQPITLYERQDCAGCRKVRETASVLDLDILLVPRPEGGRSTWPEETQPSDHKGNPTQLPFMIDPNTGFEMSDADDIVSYLFRTYGNRNRIPMALRPGVIADATAKLALAHRNGAGEKATACAGSTCLPTGFIPLEFWGYEGSPFCVVVKEVLGELEIPHMQRSCARGSPKRQVLFDRRGQFQVPYVEDLNTGVALFESSAIIEYLRKTYGNGRGEEMKV